MSDEDEEKLLFMRDYLYKVSRSKIEYVESYFWYGQCLIFLVAAPRILNRLSWR